MCRGYSFCQLACVCPHVICFSVFAGAVCLSVYETFVCLFESLSLSLSLLMCVSVCAYVYVFFSMCICERVSVFLFAEVCVAVSWRKAQVVVCVRVRAPLCIFISCVYQPFVIVFISGVCVC